MERQLQERLIGAAVLIATAVVLVPELFSGSAHHAAVDSALPTTVDQSDSSASSGQLKTYHIQLQQGSAPVPQPAVEAESSSSTTTDGSDESTTMASVAASSTSSAASSVATSRPVPSPAPVATEGASAKVAQTKVTPDSQRKTASANGKAWVVQIGSFGADGKAKQIVSSLKARDYPAYSGTVTVNGKTLYRVRIGPLAERSAAEALLGKLKRSYPEASVVPQGR